MFRYLTVFSVMLATAAPVLAQLVPASGDLQSNSYSTGNQLNTVIAVGSPAENFVVVWESYGQDDDRYGIFGQRHDSSGVPVGSEFQVNSYTVDDQRNPSVGLDPSSGRFVVAWQSDLQDGSISGVFGQFFDSSGAPIGTELQINSFTSLGQQSPAVVGNPNDGSFVVAWTSRQEGTGNYGVFARRLAGSGAFLGTEFQINSYTTNSQAEPALGLDSANGNFVVAWQSFTQDGSALGIFAQRHDSSGAPLGTEFQVNSYTQAAQSYPSVGVDPNTGAFVIAWGSNLQDGDLQGVFSRRFDSNGSALGTEFQVSSYTLGAQGAASVDVDPDTGSFVIAWTASPSDGSSYGVMARRYDSSGAPLGTEFLVNVHGYGLQIAPDVRARGDESFVVAWTDLSGQDGCIAGSNGIFARRFNSSGTALGVEFQANSYTFGSQANPSVGGNPGSFVVVWNTFSQDTSSYGVFAQRYDTSGAPLGSEFQVNSYTVSAQFGPTVAESPSTGAFVVVWTSYQDGDSFGLFGRRFDSAGAALGSEFQVNSYTTNVQLQPAVATDPGTGAFVVAWESAQQDSFGYGVFAQRYDSSGMTIGSEFQLNTYTTSSQRAPSLGVDPNTGRFVVAWHSYDQDGGGIGIFASRFDSSGVLLGSEFQVNTYTTNFQRFVALKVDSGTGNFVVSWTSENQDPSTGVFARLYDSSGLPLSGEFQVNTYTTNSQFNPSLAVAPVTGDFVIAWNSYTQDGSYSGVFARRYDSAGTPLSGEFQVNSYTTATQTNASVGVSSTTGEFVVAWQSDGQDGCGASSGRGAFFRLFAEVTPTATATATFTPTPTSVSATCPSTPASGCNVPTAGKLIVKDNTDDTKDKLVWKFGKGPLLAQADFGNPVTTNGYAFCVYDDSTLKIDLTIPLGAPWEALSTKGYQYKDPAGTNDSVTKVKLIGGDAGKSKLQLKGKGAGLAVPMPASMTQLLSGGTAIVAQMHGNGDCWETTFSSAQSTHKVNSYKGKF